MLLRTSGAVLAVLCIAGCGWSRGCARPPRTPVELQQAVRQARDECRAAQQAKNARKAKKAAARAEDAIARLRALAAAKDEPVAAEAKSVLSEADAEAREARYLADLADDERRLAEALRGVKARLYRTARPMALAATFKALALAADYAAQKGLSTLPEPLRDAAQCAASLSRRPPMDDGSPDWAGIAAEMNAGATTPPAELGFLLAAGFAVLGQTDLALVEISLVDPMNPPALPGMTTAEVLPFGFVERGVIYQVKGLRRLAVRDFTAAITVHGGAGEAENLPPFLRARVHAMLALYYLHEGDRTAADREVVEAIRADPSGPIAVFVTGERLASNGEYEKAADSMEAAMRSSGWADDWLAKRIALRARELRDKRGAAEPLFNDTSFMIEIGLHYVGEAAKASESARNVQRSMDAAKSLCVKLLTYVPGVGKSQSSP
jgi:hypothetical protein